MNTYVRKGIMFLLVAGIIFSGTAFTRANEVDDAVAKAVAYLKGQSADPTITMALVAAGESVDVEYLKSFSGSSAIVYAKPILALTVAGKDPRTFPNEDFVAKLKSFASGAQLGDVNQVNDDMWGILALASAGIPKSDSVIQNSKTFIVNNQNSDGGWSYVVGGSSDTNDTAAAIMALFEAGLQTSDPVIQSAISYLKAAQNNDGGFPYDPQSLYGTDSDANSDAWVIAAINKLGEDPGLWEKGVHNPVSHLLSLQDEDGGFWWMPEGTDFNNKGPTADAIIALTGKSFPIAKLSAPSVSEVSFRIVGSQEEICRGIVEAPTAMDVVINAADTCGYTYEIKTFSFGKFLHRINNDEAQGATMGWRYRVDGVLPNIGAGDFLFAGGEQVLWYYSDSDEIPALALGDISDSVSLSVEVVSDDGGDGGGDVPEIGFSVTPSSFNFGKLEPGNTAAGKITLQNEGEKDLVIKAEIQGDSVFHFLKIENVLWNIFETLVSAPLEKEVSIDLSIPAGFNSFGQKQGTLILWGQSE